jgi:hypothetical protein
MAYPNTPTDFDLNLFMQALGYQRWDEPDDFCLWSDGDLQFFRREDDQLVIETTVLAADEDARHDVALNRAETIEALPPEPGMHGLITLRYHLPWPTTFDDAFAAFGSIRWFGNTPMRVRLMEAYEALAGIA